MRLTRLLVLTIAAASSNCGCARADQLVPTIVQGRVGTDEANTMAVGRPHHFGSRRILCHSEEAAGALNAQRFPKPEELPSGCIMGTVSNFYPDSALSVRFVTEVVYFDPNSNRECRNNRTGEVFRCTITDRVMMMVKGRAPIDQDGRRWGWLYVQVDASVRLLDEHGRALRRP